jgi:hypothetical protein
VTSQARFYWCDVQLLRVHAPGFSEPEPAVLVFARVSGSIHSTYNILNYVVVPYIAIDLTLNKIYWNICFRQYNILRCTSPIQYIVNNILQYIVPGTTIKSSCFYYLQYIYTIPWLRTGSEPVLSQSIVNLKWNFQ